MSLFHRIFSKSQKQADELDSSQAVIVSFDLSDEFGTDEERKQITEMEDRLSEKLESSRAGDWDGHEFGDEECAIYMYGPDAARMYLLIEPILKSVKFRPIRVLLRYGAPDDENAKEEKHTIL